MVKVRLSDTAFRNAYNAGFEEGLKKGKLLIFADKAGSSGKVVNIDNTIRNRRERVLKKNKN